MALCRFGQGIVDIRGTVGGVHFKRDKSGAHCSGRARRVKRHSTAQAEQRNAFARARAYSKNNRVVSYNIYRALNNLSMQQPPADYQIPHAQKPPKGVIIS